LVMGESHLKHTLACMSSPRYWQYDVVFLDSRDLLYGLVPLAFPAVGTGGILFRSSALPELWGYVSYHHGPTASSKTCGASVASRLSEGITTRRSFASIAITESFEFKSLEELPYNILGPKVILIRQACSFIVMIIIAGILYV
jgi:hypothetical protein